MDLGKTIHELEVDTMPWSKTLTLDGMRRASILLTLLVSSLALGQAAPRSPDNLDLELLLSCPTSCEHGCIQKAAYHMQCANAPASASVRITASRTECTAPCGIFFKAEGTSGFSTSRPFHELVYHWSFSDPQSYYRSLPADFPFKRSGNRAQGVYAAHVFERPGTYEVKLNVASSSNQRAQANVIIRVLDPSATFSGTQTGCLSLAGNFSGCPSGARTFTSFSSARSFYQESGNRRLLFRAGETFATNGLGANNGLKYLSRFGSAVADPILDIAPGSTGVGFHAGSSGSSVSYLNIVGDYDVTTDSGNGQGSGISIDALNGGADHITVYRNRVSGTELNIYTGSRSSNHVIIDNVVTNWNGYGIYHAWTSSIAVVANNVKQPRNAMSGGRRHGPIRLTAGNQVLASKNDVFSNTGWSGAETPDGTAHQPGIRYNTEGYAGHSGVINENRIEGGFTQMTLSPEAWEVSAGLGEAIVERNYFITTSNTGNSLSIGFGNTTVRNNIFRTGNHGGPGPAFAVQTGHTTSSSENRNALIDVYNNTVYHHLSREWAYTPFDNNHNYNGQFRANIVYAPNVLNRTDFPDPMLDLETLRPQQGSRAIPTTNTSPIFPETNDGQLRTRQVDGALNPL